MNRRKATSLLIAGAMIATLVSGIGTVTKNEVRAKAAGTNVGVKVDGKAVNFPDAQPYVNGDNRTMVPVRFVTEALGCKVEWEGTRELVIITKGQYRILLRIGENSAVVNDGKSDVRKPFDTKAVLQEDRTFVPLRFVSETLGAGVAWDEVNNTVVIRSDGAVEVVATPMPTPTPTPTPEVTPTAKPMSDGIPRETNPIIGNPYYINGLNGKEDIKRYVRLQDLFRYNDIVSISGDYDGKDLGFLALAYGWYNPQTQRVVGYISVEARESHESFKISIYKHGEKELQRLHEVIDIVVLGTQEYKDFVYNTIINCKDNSAGGKVLYVDGRALYIKYDDSKSIKDVWGEDAYRVAVWR